MNLLCDLVRDSLVHKQTVFLYRHCKFRSTTKAFIPPKAPL